MSALTSSHDIGNQAVSSEDDEGAKNESATSGHQKRKGYR